MASPWKLRGENPFPRLRHFPGAACVLQLWPFLHLQNTLLRALLSCPMFLSNSDLSASLRWGPLWSHQAHPDTPGHTPHLEILNFIANAKPLLLCKLTFTGSRNWGGDIFGSHPAHASATSQIHLSPWGAPTPPPRPRPTAKTPQRASSLMSSYGLVCNCPQEWDCRVTDVWHYCGWAVTGCSPERFFQSTPRRPRTCVPLSPWPHHRLPLAIFLTVVRCKVMSCGFILCFSNHQRVWVSLHAY